MSKHVIFCYSGTGNCLDIAKGIATYLGDTDIILMRSAPVITDVRHAKKVGFVFPCYAGGLPGDMESYLPQIQVAEDAYTFGVVSYAGYPGIGLEILDKYIHLDYWDKISHQCSCIWLLPHGMMMPPMGPKKAQARAEKLTQRVARQVFYGLPKQGKKAPPSNAFNRLEASLWPELSAKKAKKLSASDDCIGCGQCAQLCPKGNISMVQGKPQFGSSCIGCLSCLQYCPQQAIDMGLLTKARGRYHNPKVSPSELCRKIIHID